MLLAAVAYLVITGVTSNQQYYMTVKELKSRQSELVGHSNIRIIGAVVGDTIQYDGHTLSFEVVHLPDTAAEITDEGGLAKVLHDAVANSDGTRLKIVLVDQPKPDLLKNEAQAIITGKLGEDGVFYANELLLKCPTKYQEAAPQANGQ